MARIKVEFEDQIIEKLKKLAKESPQSLDRCLRHASMKVKGYILEREIKEFGNVLRVRDGSKELKSTKFKKTGKTRYRVEVHPRFQVFEKGAYIRPVNVEALHFFIGGKEIFAKSVRIPKRKFFKPALKDAMKDDALNKAFAISLNLELERMGLKERV